MQKRRNCFSIPFTLCSVNIVFSPKKNDIYYKPYINDNAQVTGLFGKCDIENVFSRLRNIQFFFLETVEDNHVPTGKVRRFPLSLGQKLKHFEVLTFNNFECKNEFVANLLLKLLYWRKFSLPFFVNVKVYL